MNYRCETNWQEIEKYLRGAGVVAFDFETAPLPAYRDDNKAALDAHRSHIVGVSLSVAEGSAIYVPLRHLRGPNADPEQIIPFLRGALWMNRAVVKIAHNLSFEAMFLYALGVVVQPPCYDTIAAAQMTLLFIHAQHLLHLPIPCAMPARIATTRCGSTGASTSGLTPTFPGTAGSWRISNRPRRFTAA